MQIIVRASVMFLFLWGALRVMGRKELAQLSAFELVLLIVMGDLIQQGVTQQDNSITAAVLALSTMSLLVVATSYLSFRFTKVSPITEGLPVVIVRDGRVQQQLISIERITEDEVMEAA